MARFLLLILVAMTPALAFAGKDEYSSDFGESLDFRCGPQKFISYMNSKYSSSVRDRSYKVECESTSIPLRACTWKTGQPFRKFECGGRGVICGLRIAFNIVRRTRDFRYLCCTADRSFKTCRWTWFLNQYTKDMTYRVGKGEMIVGHEGRYSPITRDRKTKFKVCK